MSREANSKAHVGKTRRDKASGAWARRENNRQERASWQNDNKSTTKDFPFAVCNGQNGRRWKRWMGML